MQKPGSNTGSKPNSGGGSGRGTVLTGQIYLGGVLMSWSADGHSSQKLLKRRYANDNLASFEAKYTGMHDGILYDFTASLTLKSDLEAYNSGQKNPGFEIYWNFNVIGVPQDLDDVFSPDMVEINAFKDGGWYHPLDGPWTMTKFNDNDTTDAPEGSVTCLRASYAATNRLPWKAGISFLDHGIVEYKNFHPKNEFEGRSTEREATVKNVLGMWASTGKIEYTVRMLSFICYGHMQDEFDGEQWIGYRKAPRWYVIYYHFDLEETLIRKEFLYLDGATAPNALNAKMYLPPKGGSYNNRAQSFSKNLEIKNNFPDTSA
jgi:hypothetical protein